MPKPPTPGATATSPVSPPLAAGADVSGLRRMLMWAPALALLVGPPLHAQVLRRPTPAQTEGPYYPLAEPRDADHDLLRNGTLSYAKGRPVWLEGQVLDLEGRPLKGGSVEIWQCDEDGHYDHPGDGGRIDPAFQGFGRVQLDAEGRYRFRTLRPAAYPGRAPHIHAKVKSGRRELLTTQLYVRGDPGNARDMLWRNLSRADQEALTVPFEPAADGLRAWWPIVVAA